MRGVNFDELRLQERLVAEQAVVNFRELNKACDAAADGTVLEVCEKLAMTQGRELIRKTVQASLNLQAGEVEKSSLSASAPNKGRRRGRAVAE
ncbi:MAG: hypothetical protein AB7I48_28265 [Planctomycetaceae bacterium]